MPDAEFLLAYINAWQAMEDKPLKHLDRFIVLSVILLGTLVGNSAYSQSATTIAEKAAIGGYSPVSYFTKNKAELGSAAFSVEHNGSLYYLASQDQVELFEKDPERYRPRYKSCPYSLTLGKVVPIDPTNFKIVGDSLLLFHLSETEDTLKLWNKSELSEEEQLRRADRANTNLFRKDF